MGEKQKRNGDFFFILVLILVLIMGFIPQVSQTWAISEQEGNVPGGPVLSKGAAVTEKEGRWRVELTIDSSARSGASDVVVVVDNGKSMADKGKLKATKKATISFADTLFDQGKNQRVSVVSFSDQAQVLTGFVGEADRDIVVHAIEGLEASGSAHPIKEAIIEAQRLLDGSDAEMKTIVLLRDGEFNSSSLEVRDTDAQVEEAKASGITIYTIALGKTAELHDVLWEGQHAGDYLLKDTEVSELAATYRTIAQDLVTTEISGTVEDILGEHFVLVPNSIVTSQGWATYDEERRAVRWETGRVSPKESIDMTYLIQFSPGFSPKSSQWYPTNQWTAYIYTTNTGAERVKIFPIPMIRYDE